MTATLETPPRTRLRDGINHVAFSPDGQKVAYTDVHLNLYLPGGQTVSVNSPNEKARSSERVRDLVFAADGKSVFVASGDHIWRFDAESGQELWRFMPPRAWGFLVISPMSLAVSLTGRLAASTDNGQLLLWDETQNLIAKVAANQPQKALTFTTNREEIVGYESFAINRFDAQTGQKKSSFSLPEKAYSMAASPQGQFAGVRTLAQFLVLDTVAQRVVAKKPIEPGLPVVVCHPSKAVFAIGENYFVSLFDVSGKDVARFEVKGAEVLSVAFHPDGQLAIGRSDHTIDYHPF
jgi:WD40 repeat protein